MGIFFKKNIEFLTEHATDPDLRRYIDRFEAPRHFIDLDVYEPALDSLPRSWSAALTIYSDLFFVSSKNDTLRVFVADVEERRGVRFDTILPVWEIQDAASVRLNSLKIKRLRQFFQEKMLPTFYEEGTWEIAADSMQNWLVESNIEGLKVKKAIRSRAMPCR